MKVYCVLALATVIAAPASAQYFNAPTKTINLYDKKTGETVGTVIINGNTAIMRNAKGEHINTMSIDKDGKRTVYDPSGNAIKAPQ
jgi:hypothetical protein